MGVILSPYLQSGWQLLIMDLNIKATRTVVICNSGVICGSIEKLFLQCSTIAIRYKGIIGKSFNISTDLKEKASAYRWIQILRYPGIARKGMIGFYFCCINYHFNDRV
ncbi:uncharacterized protein LOC127239624 [Andrographis paniculata]|uniref:uncharacterized protein LOC127239624 n=1 Tax=Andrographis paniculata TaxID=175694 RepID=UPI0021E7DBE2|nr:uncharacterized protein LOC127239624 [Andrographis paniculata]